MIGKPKMQSYWPSLGTKDSMVVLLHNVCVCIRLQFPVVQWQWKFDQTINIYKLVILLIHWTMQVWSNQPASHIDSLHTKHQYCSAVL